MPKVGKTLFNNQNTSAEGALLLPYGNVEVSQNIKSLEPKINNAWSGVVLGAVIIDGGSGYVDSVGVSTIGGSGPQTGQFNCKVNITTNNGVVTNIFINSGGIGYTLNDSLIVVNGNNNCIFKANPVKN